MKDHPAPEAQELHSPPPARTPGRRGEILAAAEALARRGGYHGHSFREVAARVGIRSATVHHHFPTKPALAEAMLRDYRARFMAALGPAGERGAPLRLMMAFRAVLAEEGAMCPAGLFAAEADALPDGAAAEVGAFFGELAAWTAEAIGETAVPPARAETLVAGLEGALLAARAAGDVQMFDRIAGRLLADHR
jgi:TetR/AcrR family transcriptional repressor of nem operon